MQYAQPDVHCSVLGKGSRCTRVLVAMSWLYRTKGDDLGTYVLDRDGAMLIPSRRK